MNETAVLSPARTQNLIGTWRRFGPVYEIVAVGLDLAAGDQAMRVRVLETGEEIDYRLSAILDDPADV